MFVGIFFAKVKGTLLSGGKSSSGYIGFDLTSWPKQMLNVLEAV